MQLTRVPAKNDHRGARYGRLCLGFLVLVGNTDLWMAEWFCTAQSLRIRVYDYSGLDGGSITRAIDTANLPFQHAGIPTTWDLCVGNGIMPDIARCASKVGGGDIVLRLQASEAPAGSFRRAALGVAAVTREGGKYATVFMPGVRAFAVGWGIPAHTVLGYVMAHEIGHCLLGPGHSVDGVMRARWTRNDLRLMGHGTLWLPRQEARRAAIRFGALVGVEH